MCDIVLKQDTNAFSPHIDNFTFTAHRFFLLTLTALHLKIQFVPRSKHSISVIDCSKLMLFRDKGGVQMRIAVTNILWLDRVHSG